MSILVPKSLFWGPGSVTPIDNEMSVLLVQWVALATSMKHVVLLQGDTLSCKGTRCPLGTCYPSHGEGREEGLTCREESSTRVTRCKG